jgi:hypothetical protein
MITESVVVDVSQDWVAACGLQERFMEIPCGRVGERATSCDATHSPLIEPDKRISRHPALLKRITAGLRRQLTAASLINAPAQIAGSAHSS